MTKGLISIIIPVYQVSDYVERCIRSVMCQTYSDIECIIVILFIHLFLNVLFYQFFGSLKDAFKLILGYHLLIFFE